MAVAHKDRIDRLNLLRRLIPRNTAGQGGPDARQLLARLAEHYRPANPTPPGCGRSSATWTRW